MTSSFTTQAKNITCCVRERWAAESRNGKRVISDLLVFEPSRKNKDAYLKEYKCIVIIINVFDLVLKINFLQ